MANTTSPRTFPLSSLVPWQRAMVEAVAVATKSDPAVSAMMSLAVLSAAVGRKVLVETDSEMTPAINIWVLVVAGTGQGKTPIFGSIVQPLTMAQAALDRPVAAPGGPVGRPVPTPGHERTAWDVLLEDPLDPESEDGVVAGVGLEDAITALRGEQEHVHPGVPVDFLTDSLTPTALVELAGSQVMGIGWLAPEGGFDAWIGGGAKGTDNMRRLNGAWDGGTLRERVAGTRRVAERICLTMGVMLHEDAAAAVLRDREMTSRGYAYRYLVLVPERRIGGKVGPFGRISQQVGERYRRAVWSMMALPSFRDDARTAPCVVRLSSAACSAYWEFFNPLQERIRTGGDLHELHGWIEKMCQSVIRLAGLLHLGEHAPSVGQRAYGLFVAASTMEKAIAIGEYLIPHAQLAYGANSARERPDERRGVTEPARADPVPLMVTLADAVVALIDATKEKTWSGKSAHLLEVLCGQVPAIHREINWPQSGAGLTLRLTEMNDELRRRGLVLSRPRSAKSRMLTIRRP